MRTKGSVGPVADSPVPTLDTHPSTTASTSMPVTPRDVSADVQESEDTKDIETAEAVDPEASARAARLSFLLEKSGVYAEIIGKRMEAQRIERAKAEHRAAVREANKKTKQAEIEASSERRSGRTAKPVAVEEKSAGLVRRTTRKRKVENVQAENDKAEVAAEPVVDVKVEDAAAASTEKQYSFRQPSLITGAKLRDYQLAGVQWMISLYENGLNGILADEMGLGKTLQTISFLAHLRSKGTWGPFLIVCPLSVLHNWVTEFEKFAPTIPVIMYHGAPQHRAELRATRLQTPTGAGVGGVKGFRSGKSNTADSFPIVVTTYEIAMKDRVHLSGLLWKYIVVDEGHRLKNLDCKLIRELKSYTSANRLILTGTPLHNNLSELWSLLNFILPDIFDDLDAFQQWFDLEDVHTNNSVLNKGSIVQSLHAILKPFLLRRLKVDVEKDLPPKKEYLLYAPLTAQQKDMYQAIANRRIRQYLVDVKSGTGFNDAIDVAVQPTRKKARISYNIEEDDDKYMDDLENGRTHEPSGVVEKSAAEIGREWQISKATKQVNNMKLQNMIMQLRKISSHPFLFDWPADPKTGQLVVNEDLVNASGKMLLLNRLLDELFARGHKVLLFSQFTTMLDVIEDWAIEYKKWKVCRIDGSTSQESRREQMNEFNNGGDSPDACRLFILSTRAGGLGINLVSADTVIFFDQDWNPQMDLQAQDRAHRIGQTKPVLIFRLISAHTVEQKILEKAGNKRKLETLVISQGKFGKVVDENGNVLLGKQRMKQESMAEAAAAMLALEGEKIDIVTKDDKVISDEALDQLLDRSPCAFAREKGWSTRLGQADKERTEKGEKTAFEVFVPGRDEAADGLAAMFGEGEADLEQL